MAWVRMLVRDEGIEAQVVSTSRLGPSTQTVPLAVAQALVRAGAPVVVRHLGEVAA